MPMAATPEDYARVYARFTAPVSRFDCGRKCAPHNDGVPVCCSADHAVPIVDKSEYALLKSRTDLWRDYVPKDAAGRKIVADMHAHCDAVECKGVQFCERDNRSMACRAFPFFPYFTREKTLVGLAYYWDFEDRCWIISNLQVVDRGFVREFVDAYEALFAVDEDERAGMIEHSASMRRVRGSISTRPTGRVPGIACAAHSSRSVAAASRSSGFTAMKRITYSFTPQA